MGKVLKNKLSTFSDTVIYSLIKNLAKDSNEFNSLSELRDKKIEVDIVFHLASFIPYDALDEPNLELINTNLILTIDLIKAFPQAHIIYSSSVSVYGNSDKGVINTKSPICNPNLYGASKLASEFVVMNHPKYSIIRFSSIIGKGSSNNTFVAKMIDQAINSQKIIIWGDGSRKQNYIDIGDATDLLLACMESKANNVILGVGDKSFSNLQIAEMVNELTSCEISFKNEDNSPSFEYEIGDQYLVLGHKNKISIEQSIQEMIWQQYS